MKTYISPAVTAWLIEHEYADEETTIKGLKAAYNQAIADGELTEELRQKLNQPARDAMKRLVRETIAEENNQPARRRGYMSNVNIVPESNKYADRPTHLKHARTGQEILVDSRPVEAPTERSLAKAGVFAKAMLRRQAGIREPLPEHEQALLREVAHESLFAGPDSKSHDGWTDARKLHDYETKTLLNDSTSGGELAVPLEYDSAIVSYALLHGELYPFVDQRTASRAEIRTTTFGNVQALWNDSVDDGSATPFDTADLIGKMDTEHHPLSFLVEIGRDFLSDSAINVMAELQRAIGEAMLAELDRVIALGNGTTEPEGIFTKTGITAVPSALGTGGPLALGDLENLYFGIPKQYRNAGNRLAYVSNDGTYSKFRSLAVGSDDARRLLGMDWGSYQLNDQPARIQNDIPAGSIAFGALAKYRMFRRLGFETRFTDQGKSLFESNTGLLLVRGRFGGQIVDTNAFAKMTDAVGSGIY